MGSEDLPGSADVELSRRLREHAAHLGALLRDRPVRGEQALLEEAAAVAAEALGVPRVSVWRSDAERRVLVRGHVHVRDTGAQEAPAGAPAGAEAEPVRGIRTEVVAVDDTAEDPRLLELRRYCAERGIGALIDVPIVAGREVTAVLCHEHVGGPRVWRDAEVDFAANLGAVVALALEAERRLEDLGQMAAGVGHDFNNVLTLISLSIAHGSRSGEISAAMAYARELVVSLLSYVRREPAAAADVALDAGIRELAPVLEAELGGELRLEVDLRAPGRRVRIAPTELHQLVANLVGNAGDATRGHGRAVRVATEVRRGEPAGGEPAGGERVELRVSDDGRGMDEATRARVFEPFFTTKPPGEGTGIGLVTCRSIATRAGGTIAIESEPGAGTTVRIALPVAAVEEAVEDAGAPAPAGTAPAPAPAGAGAEEADGPRVLLVEDSPTIGALVSGVLREAGYRVVHAATAADALEALEGEPFDAVVTDLKMPNGRGEAIAAAARARGPETAIVIASAEPPAAATPGALAESGIDAVVPKPFSPEDLKAAIALAIERRRAAR